MPENDDRRNEFRTTLHTLASEGGPGQDLITLFIPADKPISEVTGYLDEEYTRSGTIRDTRQRRQVQQALATLLSLLKKYAALPEHGLALFCRAGQAETGTDLPCTAVEPPEPLTLYLFRRSTEVRTRPITADA